MNHKSTRPGVSNRGGTSRLRFAADDRVDPEELPVPRCLSFQGRPLIPLQLSERIQRDLQPVLPESPLPGTRHLSFEDHDGGQRLAPGDQFLDRPRSAQVASVRVGDGIFIVNG